MSTGLYSHTTRATGTVLTAAIYNSDHVNHITNQNPLMTGAYSDNASQMQTNTDPGAVGSESLASSLGGELERIRFVIKRLAGGAQWYSTPVTGTFPTSVLTSIVDSVSGTLILKGAGSTAATITGAKVALAGTVSVAGAATLAAASFSGTVSLTAAVSKIVPGATSLSLRNSADNADNILIADNGNTTVRGTMTATGGFIGAGSVLATEQNTTSGTSIDFTGIPSGVKQITMNLIGVSVDTTIQLALQIGDSGGIENTGYTWGAFTTSTAITSTDAGATAASFKLMASVSGNAVDTYSGQLILSLENASTNTWTLSGFLVSSNATTRMDICTGSKATSAVLDRVRLTTSSGTANFDAGKVNIQYQS